MNPPFPYRSWRDYVKAEAAAHAGKWADDGRPFGVLADSLNLAFTEGGPENGGPPGRYFTRVWFWWSFGTIENGTAPKFVLKACERWGWYAPTC